MDAVSKNTLLRFSDEMSARAKGQASRGSLSSMVLSSAALYDDARLSQQNRDAAMQFGRRIDASHMSRRSCYYAVIFYFTDEPQSALSKLPSRLTFASFPTRQCCLVYP